MSLLLKYFTTEISDYYYDLAYESHNYLLLFIALVYLTMLSFYFLIDQKIAYHNKLRREHEEMADNNVLIINDQLEALYDELNNLKKN